MRFTISRLMSGQSGATSSSASTAALRHGSVPSQVYRVGIIAGSTRPGANGPIFAAWTHEIASKRKGFAYELISLKEWKLPLFDEPVIPAHSGPTLDHTKAWSQKIASLDGFIFVSCQYNWGYPAALKNALDYLFTEWNGKPAAIITYGGRGGTKAAAQLHEVLLGLRMRVVPKHPAITLQKEDIAGNIALQDVQSQYSEQYAGEIQEAIEGLEDLLTHVPSDQTAGATPT